MLIISRDSDAADVYFTEYTRIFQHFYARWWAAQLNETHHKPPTDTHTASAPDATENATENAAENAAENASVKPAENGAVTPQLPH